MSKRANEWADGPVLTKSGLLIVLDHSALHLSTFSNFPLSQFPSFLSPVRRLPPPFFSPDSIPSILSFVPCRMNPLASAVTFNSEEKAIERGKCTALPPVLSFRYSGTLFLILQPRLSGWPIFKIDKPTLYVYFVFDTNYIDFLFILCIIFLR